VEQLGLLLEGALLIAHAPEPVAEAFCASRLAGDSGRAFGTLPAGVNLTPLLDRTWTEHAARDA
jgi:putative acyl-CoA dehydrogenase